MSFEKTTRIPGERVGVLIGRSGATKSRIERSCRVSLAVDGESGEVTIRGAGDPERMEPFKAEGIVTAIGRGFSPEAALELLADDAMIHVIDLRDFAGKSATALERIRGRLIGEGGRARRSMEHLSGTRICVYGKTVSIIGRASRLRRAVDAVSAICSGSMHGSVYGRLEAANRRTRMERMILWEDQNVG